MGRDFTMSQYYGLSEIEFLIMEMIWNHEKPLYFNEIMNHFSNKAWKKQTLHTHLTRLVNKGVLSYTKDGKIKMYYPALTKEEYVHQWTRNFMNDSFDGSLSKFMSAFVGNHKELSQRDLEELKRFLEE